MPIDSGVAAELRSEAKLRSISIAREIRQWSGIKPLRPNTHAMYQRLAIEVAGVLATKRVHLDAYFFRRANES